MGDTLGERVEDPFCPRLPKTSNFTASATISLSLSPSLLQQPPDHLLVTREISYPSKTICGQKVFLLLIKMVQFSEETKVGHPLPSLRMLNG